jgi:predicted dienelactone hydrolase
MLPLRPLLLALLLPLLPTCAREPRLWVSAQERTPRQPRDQPAAAELYSSGGPELFAVRHSRSVKLVARDGKSVVEVALHYPDAHGPFPVIVFSHGLGGSKDGYLFLGQWWASHGYVCIHPTHAGSDASLFAGENKVASLHNMRTALSDPAILEGRPREIAQVIDQLGDLESAVPELKGHLDRERVGVGGHSFGAYTALAVAGARVDLPRRADSEFGDSRPRAFLALSPQGRNALFDEHAWERISRPVLLMTGSLDVQPRLLSATGEERPAEWRTEPYRYMPEGDKFLVWIEGARHSTFSNGAGAKLSGDPAPDPGHVSFVQACSLAYWDAYLKELPAAKEWLAGDACKRALEPGMVRCERK